MRRSSNREWACVLLFILSMCGAAAAAEQQPVEQPELSAIEERFKIARAAKSQEYLILPHRPSYVLPVTYNASMNREPYGAMGDKLSPVEVMFQLSVKMPLAEGLFGKTGDLYFAYTQVSFWQAYNHAISAPFRETNYEPEGYMQFSTNTDVLGLRNRLVRMGFVHQSNGREEPMSRSWNRAYLEFLLDRGDFAVLVKPWYRFQESAETDDNPDILRYMGPGEVRLFYAWDKYITSLLLRYSSRSDATYGAFQLESSFPLAGRLKGYVRYFYGYGDSLIDYNARSNRLGVGILLADWL